MERSTDHGSRVGVSRSKQAVGPGRVWKPSDYSGADEADTKRRTPLTDRIAKAEGQARAVPAVRALRRALLAREAVEDEPHSGQ